jgi:acyl-CoA thioesterase FadM
VPRHVTDKVPAVTMLFGPTQLRPRAVLDLAAAGFGRWMAAHAGVPMPRMITDHHAGVVVHRAAIDFHRPDLAFAGTDWLTARTRLGVDTDRTWLQIVTDYLDDHDTAVAACHLVCRVLRLGVGADLAARPSALPDALTNSFTPDDHIPFDPRAARRENKPADASEELVQPHEWTFPILRTHCETADQWSFVEMIDLAGQARERLYAEGFLSPATTTRAIAAPLRAVRATFRRPMFVFDHCRVTTSARINIRNETEFHHRFSSPGSDFPHLVVVETLDQPS